MDFNMEVGSGFWTRVRSGFDMVSRVEVGFRGRISRRGSRSGFSLSELGSNFEMGVGALLQNVDTTTEIPRPLFKNRRGN
ncbi:hypothetical protein TIFTF001_041906 [Ficus carica]|uniref:Uncharacterized protein n=1 Tax=Ficus carica TaxID=3494 RepID=A0AA87ZK25_FICCA|nr:hypothetical protein TIFTF001_041906 [Ficus carica]